MAVDSLTDISNRTSFTNTFTAEFDNDASESIITPTSGKSIKVVGVKFSTEGTGTAGESIRLSFDTTGDTIFEWYPSTDPDSFDTGDILIRGAQNEVITLNSDLEAENNFFIAVNYREE
jgi:hypothetical protein